MFSFLRKKIACRPENFLERPLHKLFFGGPWDGSDAQRLLVLYERNRISYTSAYPFIYFADEFRARYNVQIRLYPVKEALSNGLPVGLSNPDQVIAQTWLTDPMSVHEALASLLSNFPASTTTAYQDTFANADIRLAPTFKNVDFYYKKSLFVETSEYLRPTFGHTNLTEYYGKLYSLADEMTDWQVPETALPKLRLAPNFLTNPELLDAILEKPERLSQTERNIDIHARLGGTKQEGWYGEMRRQAEKSMSGLRNLNITSGQGVSRQAFAEEMSRSKVCFSPFGFGELCWRDIEAIAAGAVLLKPNMSHLRTEPDLYQDGKTYVACRWDFADLQERVEYLLSNPALRQNLADQAWEIAYDYLTSGGPVSAYSDMFAPHSKAGDVR